MKTRSKLLAVVMTLVMAFAFSVVVSSSADTHASPPPAHLLVMTPPVTDQHPGQIERSLLTREKSTQFHQNEKQKTKLTFSLENSPGERHGALEIFHPPLLC